MGGLSSWGAHSLTLISGGGGILRFQRCLRFTLVQIRGNPVAYYKSACVRWRLQVGIARILTLPEEVPNDDLVASGARRYLDQTFGNHEEVCEVGVQREPVLGFISGTR